MIVVYRKIPAEDIRKDAKEAVVGVGKWFANNPKRRVCRMELWYGKQLTVNRKNYTELINKAAEEAIGG